MGYSRFKMVHIPDYLKRPIDYLLLEGIVIKGFHGILNFRRTTYLNKKPGISNYFRTDDETLLMVADLNNRVLPLFGLYKQPP